MPSFVHMACRAMAVAFACVALAGHAHAQAFPSKPIRFIVPEQPGGSPDTAARAMAPEISKLLGQPVVIEYKPGAGQLIGLEYVAKNVPADGYTVLMASATNLAILPVTTKDLRFDPLKDLPPVIWIGDGNLLLVSPAKMPWKSVQELIAYAKANPGKVNFGSPNAIVRLASESFVAGTGIQAMLVPYSSSGVFFQALAAGEDLHFGFVSIASALTLGDRIKILAQTGDKRRPLFQDAPTFNELGLPQIRGLSWTLNVPAATPAPVIEKLHAATSAVLKNPNVRASLEKMQLDVVDRPPDAAARALADNARQFAEIAKSIGYKAE